MIQPALTQFQHNAEQAIVRLLAEAGLAVTQRAILTGAIPFYSKEPEVVVRLTVGEIEVWLFDDQANVSSSKDARFERADFETADDLLKALLDNIREEISR